MPHVRHYHPSDRDALYDVCLRTGADGDDATDRYHDPRLLGSVFVGPYLEFHPDLAWVVDNDGTAAGYILCAPDTRAFEAQCEREWWPELRRRYPLGSFPATSTDEEVVGLIHAPPTALPETVTSFPAHLHIDLVPEVQGLHLGGALVAKLLDALTARGSIGVHLGVSTANIRAIGFYKHLGFDELAHDDTTTTMGKRLNLT
ncbi:MAG: GNAT family N-acetyltransferase [Salinibacterium sp.]|nr:GNAT family N-acetyltransferase [Salinibacterium sp.]